MTKVKLTDAQIMMEIYRRMYKEAEPSASIDKIVRSGEGKKPDFFLKYYLDQKRQEQIIDEVLDKNNIKKDYLRGNFRTSIMLGSAPTGNREIMLKERGKKR